MKLYIHKISHPITQYLSSITQDKINISNIHHQLLNQLGSFLIYETVRNWLKIHTITIKQINTIKKTIIIDPNESFIIITNTSKNLSLIQDAQYLLPDCNIELITSENSQITDFSLNNKLYNPYQVNTKIIIVTKEIQTKYTIELINHLINQYKIKIEQIRLACINCKTENLQAIGKNHPKLNIFTTNILQKNS